MDIPVNPLPKLLRHYRLKKGYTQGFVAKELGISRSGYANYEEGRSLPGVETITSLSRILEYDFLFAYVTAARAMGKQIPFTPVLSDTKSYFPEMIMYANASELTSTFGKLSLHDQRIIQSYIHEKLEEENY